MSVKRKFAADEIVVAWQGFAVGYHAIPAGTRLRGNHEAVRLAPQNFVPDGTPANEMPHYLDEAIAQAEAQPTAPKVEPRIDPGTPVGRLMICRQGVIDSAAGPCPEGRVVLDTDPLVAAAGEAFTPFLSVLGGPVTPLMSRVG